MNRNQYNTEVDNHADRLYRFILKSINNNEMAKDVVQDVFTKLWEKHEGVDFTKVKSISFPFMHTKGSLAGDRFYLSPGIGLNWNSYFFENNIAISTSNDSTVFITDSVLSNDKYKLRATYLQVPIILETRMGKLNNPLGIQIGVVGSYKISWVIKQKYTFDEAKYRSKTKNDFNISPFKLEAIARVTIGDMGVYARYSLTTLFEKDKAPELYPISVGLTFGGF